MSTPGLVLPLPGPVALAAVAAAEANLDVHEEGGNNQGKFVEIYLGSVGLGPGAPWCAAWVHYRLSAAAADLRTHLPQGFPRSGYCPDYERWGKARGFYMHAAVGASLAKRGDLVLFYFPAKQRVAHIGLVAGPRSDGRGVITVEGNTGPPRGSGVERDGDGVYRKSRLWSELGAGGGFIRFST